MPARLPVVLSPTRSEDRNTCGRKHVLKNILDRHKYRSPSADFGTVMHSGANHWWHGIVAEADPHKLLIEATEIVEAKWDELRPTGDKHSKDMAVRLMQYYPQMRFAGIMPGEWHVAQYNGQPMIEQRIELQVGTHILSFQVDRACENDADDIAMIDLKTAARINAYWHRQWELSPQMKLYRLGLKQIFPEARRITLLVEGIEKNIPFKFDYHTCPEWSSEQLEEISMQWQRLAERDAVLLELCTQQKGTIDLSLVAHYALNGFTDFDNKRCWDYGMECEYLDLCKADVEHRVGLLHSDYDVIPVEGY